jgi:hypothetical protein
MGIEVLARYREIEARAAEAVANELTAFADLVVDEAPEK